MGPFIDLFGDLARASTFRMLQASAILGVCFHIAIARASLEFEQYMFPCLAFASLLNIGGTFVAFINGRQSVAGVIVQAFILWTGFIVGCLASISSYRLFLHRCRSFPGPVAAKLTRFYAAHLNAKDTQFYQELDELHKKYGDYLRMGPREVSILDPAAIPIIYGPNTKCTKSTWYTINGLDSDRVSINGMRDTVKYRLRRRPWDRGTSIKATKSYEPRIKAHTDMLVQQLRIRADQPLDISTWSFFYSFDVMGDLGFGKPFTNMETGEEHPGIRAMHDHMWILGVVQAIPWLPVLVSAIPGANVGLEEFFGICENVLEQKKKNFDNEKEPTDIVGWLLKAIQEKEPSASPTKESLSDDTRGVIIAGSDTTANTLANALFFLTKHPERQQKLRKFAEAALPSGYASWDYARVKSISYLDDIINETLRLKPPVIQGTPRETPAKGIRIGNKYIPGYVNVSVPMTPIQRDARRWKQPHEFIPERWTEMKDEMNTDSGPWFPFQMGMHACVGKNLAYLTLRTALTAIVLNFDITFAPGETGDEFDGNYLSSLMMTLRPLQLIFTPRSAS
ncbi:cytochrome P450 [Pyrenochaeta sp. MPI-SDFR-AT-0127]|nr:cytochrome P450 [Pyrenochaeta sp. MPI-SDFR-AT-0127]